MQELPESFVKLFIAVVFALFGSLT